MHERVDLSYLVAGNAGCESRGCLSTYMERIREVFDDEDGDEVVIDMWIVFHKTSERWAKIPVSPEIVEDAKMWPGMMCWVVDRAHEVMDHLRERPNLEVKAR